MKPPELLWQRLLRARRAGGPPPAEPSPVTAPPWFARRVVQQWRSRQPAIPSADGWERVSRHGLAWALAVMTAAVVLHVRTPRTPQPWEVLASESVVSSVLPR